MSIFTPTENVKLTFEQMQQIDTVQKILTNLQSEVAIATKTLNVLKKDCDKVTNERIYQEELLANLKIQVDEFEGKKNTLIKDSDSAIGALNETIQKINDVSIKHQEKIADLNEREKSLSSKELEHSKKVEDFNLQNSILIKEKETVNEAKKAISEAVSKVSW